MATTITCPFFATEAAVMSVGKVEAWNKMATDEVLCLRAFNYSDTACDFRILSTTTPSVTDQLASFSSPVWAVAGTSSEVWLLTADMVRYALEHRLRPIIFVVVCSSPFGTENITTGRLGEQFADVFIAKAALVDPGITALWNAVKKVSTSSADEVVAGSPMAGG